MDIGHRSACLLMTTQVIYLALPEANYIYLIVSTGYVPKGCIINKNANKAADIRIRKSFKLFLSDDF